MERRYSPVFALAAVLVLTMPAAAATWLVGPNRAYATPCAAITVASAGDTILIDRALYQNDTCAWYTDNLTLIGLTDTLGRRPHIDASGLTDTATTGHLAQYKGIWVPYGNDTVVENIEFSGATLSNNDGANGAGIRIEGVNMTILNCSFHDNQDGILESNIAGSNIVIEYSEFYLNGVSDPSLDEGYGETHNLYIGRCASLRFAFNWSHDANVGHLLKSRAAVNYILYNRLTGENGTDSYEIDLANGGTSYVIGNLVEKGPNAGNDTMLRYGEEGLSNPGQDLYVVNNSFVHPTVSGGYFVSDASSTTPALLENNIFYGTATITDQSTANLVTNSTSAPQFVDLDLYNYHLRSGSPDIGAGTQPSTANGYSLTPQYEYVQFACGQVRPSLSQISIGAYEFGPGGPVMNCHPRSGLCPACDSSRLLPGDSQ